MTRISVDQVGDLDLIRSKPHATSIFINGIDIDDLSPYFESVAQLTRLIIRDCPNLRRLPKPVEEMSKLKYLRLVENPNLDLSDFDLSILAALTDFQVFGIAGERLHPSLSGLKKLRTLIVSECRNLLTLPTELSTLGKLSALAVSKNPVLRNFPFEQKQLRRMQRIDLHGNPKMKYPAYLSAFKSKEGALSAESQSGIRRYFDRTDRTIREELKAVIDTDGHLFPSWWKYEIEYELTGVMRVSGFLSDTGAALVFESISYSPGQGGIVHSATSFCTIDSLDASTTFYSDNAFYHDLVAWDETLHEAMSVVVKGEKRPITIAPRFAADIQAMRNSDGKSLPAEAVLLFAVCDQVEPDDLFGSPEEIKVSLDLPNDAELLFKLGDWDHLSGFEYELPTECGEISVMLDALDKRQTPEVKGQCSWRKAWEKQWPSR